MSPQCSQKEIIHKLFQELHKLLEIEEALVLKGDDMALKQSTLDLLARADTGLSVIATKLSSGGTGDVTTAEVDAAITPRVQAIEALAGTTPPGGGV